MSGYREKESLKEIIWPSDRCTLPYISAQTGFGLLPIGIFILVTGGSLILGAVAALMGALLLIYGLRNY
jgi:hypothetical protein